MVPRTLTSDLWYMHTCTPHHTLIVTNKIAQNQSTCTSLFRIYTLVTIIFFFWLFCFFETGFLVYFVDESGLELRVPVASAS